ncbi:MAG TPA: hypothetical protein VH165_25955, partial [Kofleriaceae bacterium]|nr:hypothetical protein [Kofleriaceae bacterium]
MTRLVFVTVMVGVLAVSRLASAQSTGSDTGTGTLPNGATIEFQHLKVYDPDNKEFIETEANSDDRLRGFNRAQCNCARKHTTKYTGGGVPAVSDPKSVGWFQYLVIESASSGLHVPVEFWVGSECTVDETRLMTCKQLPYAQISDLDNSLFAKNGTYLSFNLYDVVNGKLHDEDTATTTDPGSDSGSGSDPASCQPLETNSPIYAFVSSTGSSDTFDYETSQNAGTLSTDADTTANGIDTDPPVPPTNVQATASDQSINIKWTPPSDRNTDVAYYQALCADMTGSVVKHRVADHKYVTTKSLCSDAAPSDYESESLTATASSSANNEMPVGPLVGGAFGDLHDAFICGEASSATANSLSITGLTNGTPYQVIFLEIDLHGNFVGTYFDHTITPVPVTDFWEDLHDRGSKTEGGLCLLAETYGDDSGLTQTLRAFRDDTLGGSPVGRWFGRAYYATLGRLGWLVHGSLALRIVSGVVLSPLVVLALLWHWLTLPGLFALIVAARLAWRRRRALRRLAWSVRAGLVRAGLVRRAGLVAGAGVAALLLVAAPGRAHADKPDPYWQNDPLDSSTDSNGAPTPDPNFDPNFDPSIPTDRNANNPFAEAQANDNPQDVPPSE